MIYIYAYKQGEHFSYGTFEVTLPLLGWSARGIYYGLLQGCPQVLE